MKTCSGCKHFIHVGMDYPVCKVQDGPWEYQTDPYTGHEALISLGKHGALRPSARYMRERGDCGPERSLYQPSLWRRVFGGKK
jgi:hypothetical protein